MRSRHAFTVIELLVALILAGLVAWFAFDFFRDEHGNYRRTKEKIKLQADARDAMRVVEIELRNAGYSATVATSATRLGATVSTCPEVEVDLDGSSILATNNSTSLSTGDQVVFRGYQIPFSGPVGSPKTTACGTGSAAGFQEIGYRLNGGTLQRYFRSDLAAAVSWVPFLENVVTFQMQYGIAGSATPPWSEAQFENAANWTSTGGSITASGGNVVLGGWSTAPATWRTAITGFNLTAGSTYRVAFSLSANTTLRDSASSGTVTGYDRATLYAGIVNSTGSFLDSIRIWAGDPGLATSNVELLLTPRVNANGAQFAIKGKLKATGVTATPAQTLTIVDPIISMWSAGTFLDWKSAPTSVELASVKAVRVTILAKTDAKNQEGTAATFTGAQMGDPLLPTYTAPTADTKRSHILLQRIVPVVNNGL